VSRTEATVLLIQVISCEQEQIYNFEVNMQILAY